MQRNLDKSLPHLDTPKVLLVEDSKFFASIVSRRIEKELGFQVDWMETYAKAAAAIDCCKDSYIVALLDLHLPDAPNGEIIQHATKRGIPGIIFTAGIDSDFRSNMLTWSVVDYILKDSESCVDNLIDVIRRIHKNSDIKVMVVDDSLPMRNAIIRLLETQRFQVVAAANGVEALEVLAENPDIKLIVTDYDMPEMDGFELIAKVRKVHSKNNLAIIGMSASGDPLLSAKLIKSGANDFVPKPFQVEEFHCRVGHSIEMLENIALIRDLSYKDSLTRLHNRRYFFENADTFVESAQTRGQTVSVAMLDIDFFKKVNDTYGHDGGDVVLRKISALIRTTFSEDAITCRFGGEEFCVLLAHEAGTDALARFDELRQSIEDTVIQVDTQTTQVTISTGICSEPDTVEAMLKLADSRLYTAKETGRNRVVGKPPTSNVRD
ncbi:diguanylate cyclase [Pseudodesulfovibrio nedwellii]|uniref:diguanylate cyclase n=1 Tax=Pseudodesulfovibrio nedwellii TaxID=2973072 RepID=A0ABM8B1I4_9BACT|nr:diguanylate cyclase [Pseudodesulfovibrio nedwellii]BDQ37675.1 diguanylate cyclase [Pseudodesulfovibrio nedwellii]